MKNSIQLIIILICTLLFTQCRKDEIITEVTPNVVSADATDVSFLAVIKDVNGTAIDGATLTINDTAQSFTSDENGVVLFKIGSIDFTGSPVTIEKVGYSKLTKNLTGITNSHSKINIVLTKAASKIINTGESGSIGEGTLSLPTSLLSTNSAAYTGPVSVSYTYLNPDNNDFLDAAPGNLIALNTENEYQQLASLGMYNIELYDEQNNKLTIPTGSQATLSFPVADVHKGTVPDEIPLWYFDENQGIWIEDGKATLDGDMMKAEVSHFTWWNCDLPYDFIPLCMNFIDHDGNPATSVEVSFSIDGVMYGKDFTDREGNILTKTPTGTVVTIKYYINKELIGSQDIGPFNENSDKPIITLTYEVSTVSGVAVDCDMNNISLGYVAAEINEFLQIFPITEGNFSFKTTNTGDINVVFYDVVNGKSKPQIVPIQNNGDDVPLGNILVCEDPILTGIRGTVMMDTNGDAEADAPAPGRDINIWGDAMLDITTNADGTYEVFLPPGKYKLFLNSPDPTNVTQYGIDNINDGDEYDGNKGLLINCTVGTDEIDEGNDFFILPPSQPSISGRVMIDNDGDGLGDVPFTGGSVKFILPGGSGVSSTPIGPDGTYSHDILIKNWLYDGYLTVDEDGYSPVSDYDESPDPEGDDSAEGPNNRIPVNMSFNEDDADNNFVVKKSERGEVSGRVMEDTDGDGIGDVPAAGVEVSIDAFLAEFPLQDMTDENGEYKFVNIFGPYNYEVSISDSRYESISDYDETPDPDGDDSSEGANNLILVLLSDGEHDADNNFVVVKTNLGSISGYVSEDTDNDDIGETPLADFAITLMDVDSGETTTTTTDENGYYEFTDLEAGEYIVTGQDEAEIDEDYVDVYDGDESDDGDINDVVLNQDDRIEVTLLPDEHDEGNNFVEEQLGSISGTLTLDTDNSGTGDTPQVGVTISLTDNDTGETVTTTSDGNGDYKFENLETGDYTISAEDPANSQSISDDDDTPEDVNDNDGVVDNMINVTLKPGEDDNDNNFLDKNN